MTKTINLVTVLLFFTVSSIISVDTEPKSNLSEIDRNEDSSVLLFTKTEGWRHGSIEAGVEAIYQLGNENNFNVTWTEDSDYFTKETLSNYHAVIFLNTTRNLFDADQKDAFCEYIQNGGGFVGIHSATDTEHDWPWFGELVGAYFKNHPRVTEAVNVVVDSDHPSTRHLPDLWVRSDEWYNFGYINDQVNILLRLDTDSYEGSEHPGNHPISWYHDFDGGRSFYTGGGHTIESFSEPLFLDHLLGGIQYAMGIK